VTRLASFGAFVELAEGVEGLCHISELPSGTPQNRPQAAELLELEREYDFKIIKLNPAEKKIGLSLRAVATEAERRDIEEYLQQQGPATSTLEEMVGLKERGGSQTES
jgi:small subunit ribosomal protein S1